MQANLTMTVNEWDIEDADSSILSALEKLEQREMIRQKRLAAIRLRMSKRLLTEERLKTIEEEKIARDKMRHERRAKYFVDRKIALNKIKTMEAEMCQISDGLEKMMGDILFTINRVIDDVEMLEAVEIVARKMDQAYNDMEKAVESVYEVSNGDNNSKTNSKIKKLKKAKLELRKTSKFTNEKVNNIWIR